MTTDQATGAALLRAILEDPAADDLRLIYADWLEEHGEEERARFIRYAIRVPHCSFVELTKTDPFPLLGFEPVGEVSVGFPAIKRTWMWGETDELGCVVYDLGRELDYRQDRGFISAVRCKFWKWLEYGSWLVKRHPVVVLFLTDQSPGVADLRVSALNYAREEAGLPNLPLHAFF